ncbi:unica hit a merda (plasmid) [Candidatus Trichorickettsia mobilis]|jgi:hypothetical protein|uniref:Unica hit a merda n=1 Tax=Candidatus Trichorickettsia mobilis TaxID=1346319 RepID=A0ABZ0UVG3_9RICK|nr:hypothetical protein [Candidatus Trichorickettsia mobilis]WPY01496.1 unica hit a merda [Candidatus Trichorickettsia mobilis]
MNKLVSILIIVLILSVSIFVYLFTEGVVSYSEVKAIELVSILLTVATITLTGVAIIVAIAAVWGYNTILVQASESAKQEAYNKLRNELLPDLRKEILEEVDIKFNAIKDNDNSKQEDMLNTIKRQEV